MFETELLIFIFISVALIVIAMIRSNNILIITLLSSTFSLFTMVLYLVLDAPDVAMTESSISILAIIFAIYAIKAIYPVTYIFHDPFKPILFILSLVLAAILIYAAQDLPEFGAPKFNQYYLRNSESDTGVISVVAAVLASYRGYDTMLETLVILVGGLSILLISDGQAKVSYDKQDKLVALMSRFMLPIILLFALYIQSHGEISPGGGFQAGSIIAAIFIGLAMACEEYVLISKNKLKVLAVTGVGLYFLVGLTGLIAGVEFLNYNIFFGQAIGIMLVEYVVGMAVASTMILIYLGISDVASKSL